MTASWVIVADNAIARIYEQHDGGELRSIAEFSNQTAHLPRRELGSDRPGRRVDSFGHRHALGSERDDPKKRALHAGMREIARYVDDAHSAGRFAGLTLVAAPRVLGVLRDALSPPCRSAVTREVVKDLVHSTDADLQAHLTQADHRD
jgi:protein required for attachment to host cells